MYTEVKFLYAEFKDKLTSFARSITNQIVDDVNLEVLTVRESDFT